MRVRSLPVAAALLVGVAGGVVSPLEAQGRKASPSVARRAPERPQRPPGNPARELDRFAKMSPQEREKQLSKLPPERRQQIQTRLERYQSLSPQQRAQLQQRFEAFQKLSPERQDAVRSEIQNLRSLPPAQRKERLNNPDVQQNFSNDEQKLLRQSLGPPDEF